MSLADQLARFNRLAANQRADLFVAEAHGPNLSFTSSSGTVTRFRAPFTRSSTELDFREAGVTHRVDAIAQIPDNLGLSFAVGDRITHLASGDVFRVWRVVAYPHSGMIRVALKLPSLATS